MTPAGSLPLELDLPLEDPTTSGGNGARHRHLLAIPGVDEAAAARLERAFPTLAALYAAPESQIAAVVGPVTAARVRWFLDAPLWPGGMRRRPGWRRAA